MQPTDLVVGAILKPLYKKQVLGFRKMKSAVPIFVISGTTTGPFF